MRRRMHESLLLGGIMGVGQQPRPARRAVAAAARGLPGRLRLADRESEQATPGQPIQPDGPEFGALRRRLRDGLTEPDPATAARISTAIECLSNAGRPVGCELVVDGCYDSGWALMHAGDALIACTTVRVIGVSRPIAVSIMAGTGMRAVGAA